MRKASLIFSIAALAILLSCSKENEKTLFASQETKIEQLISSLISSDTDGSAYTVSCNGSQRVVLSDGEGPELTSSGTVTFQYAGYYLSSASLSSSNLFDTNISELASSLGWDVSNTEKYELAVEKMSDKNLVKGLYNGLLGVKAGEDCYVLFSGKYGFGKQTLGIIPSNSALAYHLLIIDVSE